MRSLPRFGWLVLATLVLAGCAPSPAHEPTTPPSSSIASSAAASSAAATSAPPAPRSVSISDASSERLLQASDAPSTYGRQALSPDEAATSTRLPCAPTSPATDAQIVDRNGMSMSFTLQPRNAFDSYAAQVLTLYRPGAAAQYMSELAAALAACPSDQGLSYTVDASNFAGDQSVLIRVAKAAAADSRVPSVSSWYQVVMRADDVVMVLKVAPFESGSVPRETVDTMLNVAIGRAED